MPGIPDYEYQSCKFTVDGPVATFMWSNPRYRNAYDGWAWEGLHNAIEEVKDNDDIRVLVMTGDPEGRNFCGGLNVKSLYEGRLKRDGESDKYEAPESARFKRGQYHPDSVWGKAETMGVAMGMQDDHPKGKGYGNYLRWRTQKTHGGFMPRRGIPLMELDKPTIAMVNGNCYGFGCDIAFYNDIIIAADTANFQWTYIHRGMVAAEGATYMLPRIAGYHVALEALWRGKDIPSQQAYEWGLINHVVSADELKDYTYNLAMELATESPPMIMGAIKYTVLTGYHDYVRGLERHLDELVGPGMRSYEGSEDSKEGMQAFVEKRKPVYKYR